jgi:hypothetical protein
MKPLISFVVLLGLAVFGTTGAFAQQGIFNSYAELRETLDASMMSGEVDRALVDFGGGDEYTKEQLRGLRSRYQSVYPQPMMQKAIMRKEVYLNGFRRELIVYWRGSKYVYVDLFIQDTGKQVIAIMFRYNSDYDELAVNY